MNREEYIARMNAEDDWTPGWDAIDGEFAHLYPGQEPDHFDTDITSRSMFGGDCHIDGFSVYDSGGGSQVHRHLWHGRTLRRRGGLWWRVQPLGLRDDHQGRGRPSATTLQTVHGEVSFIQLVGIAVRENEAIREASSNIQVLVEKMRKDGPELVTDLARDFSYL